MLLGGGYGNRRIIGGLALPAPYPSQPITTLRTPLIT